MRFNSFMAVADAGDQIVIFLLLCTLVFFLVHCAIAGSLCGTAPTSHSCITSILLLFGSQSWRLRLTLFRRGCSPSERFYGIAIIVLPSAPSVTASTRRRPIRRKSRSCARWSGYRLTSSATFCAQCTKRALYFSERRRNTMRYSALPACGAIDVSGYGRARRPGSRVRFSSGSRRRAARILALLATAGHAHRRSRSGPAP